jgi:hypothetical protein
MQLGNDIYGWDENFGWMLRGRIVHGVDGCFIEWYK